MGEWVATAAAAVLFLLDLNQSRWSLRKHRVKPRIKRTWQKAEPRDRCSAQCNGVLEPSWAKQHLVKPDKGKPYENESESRKRGELVR